MQLIKIARTMLFSSIWCFSHFFFIGFIFDNSSWDHFLWSRLLNIIKFRWWLMYYMFSFSLKIGRTEVLIFNKQKFQQWTIYQTIVFLVFKQLIDKGQMIFDHFGSCWNYQQKNKGKYCSAWKNQGHWRISSSIKHK